MAEPERTGTFSLLLTTAVMIPCVPIARLASSSKINCTTVFEDSVVKQRRWYANLLRIPGNLILRFRRIPTRVLSSSQWHQRESELANATIENGKVKLKTIPGTPLSSFLASESDAHEKHEAVTSAMRALFEFHLRTELSHGDASADNVMIERLSDRSFQATWFDFDVAHFESTDMDLRRADDMRALLFTSQPWLSEQEFSNIIMEWIEHYPDENVLAQFQNTMSRPLSHCDVFHLAQRFRVQKPAELDSEIDSALG